MSSLKKRVGNVGYFIKIIIFKYVFFHIKIGCPIFFPK